MRQLLSCLVCNHCRDFQKCSFRFPLQDHYFDHFFLLLMISDNFFLHILKNQACGCPHHVFSNLSMTLSFDCHPGSRITISRDLWSCCTKLARQHRAPCIIIITGQLASQSFSPPPHPRMNKYVRKV